MAAKQGARVRGVVGQVRWGYYDAARLEGYTAQRDPKTQRWSLRARVVPGSANAFNMRQRPLRFIAPYVIPAKAGKPELKRQWEWLVEDADITAGVLTARLEPLGSF